MRAGEEGGEQTALRERSTALHARSRRRENLKTADQPCIAYISDCHSLAPLQQAAEEHPSASHAPYGHLPVFKFSLKRLWSTLMIIIAKTGMSIFYKLFISPECPTRQKMDKEPADSLTIYATTVDALVKKELRFLCNSFQTIK